MPFAPARRRRALVAPFALAALVCCPWPGSAAHASPSAAVAELPARGDGSARVADARSGLSLSFRLSGAAASAGRHDESGWVVFDGAIGGASWRHRVLPHGIEDEVVFAEPPASPEVLYAIDASRAAGLRLVGGALEALDEHGAPRLRVSPPFLIDARGERRPAEISLEGCAADRDPSPPWGRPVTPPGASECVLRVSWAPEGLAYPLVLDPSWTATGAMGVTRARHKMVLLPDGRPLALGGEEEGVPPTAEIYDAASGTWAFTKGPIHLHVFFSAAPLPDGVLVVGDGAAPERYVADKGAWQKTGATTAKISESDALVLPSGKILVAGAASALYDAAADAWVDIPALPDGLAKPRLALLEGGKVLAANATAAAYYLPESNEWSPVPAPPSPPGSVAPAIEGLVAAPGGALALLVDDESGVDINGFSARFDAASGSWSPLSSAKVTSGVNVLPVGNGTALLTGGYASCNPACAATPAVSLLDGDLGAGSDEPPLLAARSLHAAVRLPSGQVLVSGGLAKPGSPLASAELFDGLGSGGSAGSGGSSGAAGSAGQAGGGAGQGQAGASGAPGGGGGAAGQGGSSGNQPGGSSGQGGASGTGGQAGQGGEPAAQPADDGGSDGGCAYAERGVVPRGTIGLAVASLALLALRRRERRLSGG